jgi:hypothetical protein
VTKPQVLIEPSGTTSTNWSTSGTAIGVNGASGFTGNLLDLQTNNTSEFSVNSQGTVTAANVFRSGTGFRVDSFGAFVGINAGSRFLFNSGNIKAASSQFVVTRQTATGVVGTTAINWNSGNIIEFTFGAGNETFTYSNIVDGATYTIAVIQDATGSRTLTWPATTKWVGGSAPTLSSGAGKRDIFRFYTDGTNLYEISRALDVR